MKLPIALLLSIAVSALLFSGCTSLPASGSNSAESTTPAPSGAADVLIDVDYATDELLNKYDSVNEFVESEEAGYQKIILIPNIAVKNFNFTEIGHKEEDFDVVLLENASLYSTDELSPEKPFVVTWMEQGTIPRRGISFVDTSNITRHFYLTMSGENGSLILVEFQSNQSK